MIARYATAALAAAALAGALPAQGPDADDPVPERGTLRVMLDNDWFVGADDHYTNGAQIAWSSAPQPCADGSARERVFGLSVAQYMFTPQDLADPNPIPNDMPYTGILLAGGFVSTQDLRRFEAFSLEVGVSGPDSGAEHNQREVHDWIDDEIPQGWDNQGPSEALVQVGWERRRRLAAFGCIERLEAVGWGGDVIGRTGVMLGNVQTLVDATVQLRWGWNPAPDYRMPAMPLGQDALGEHPVGGVQRADWSCELFGAVGGTVYPYAIYWDGNLFLDGPSVDRQLAAARAEAGVRVRFLERCEAEMSWTLTTVPWENPEDDVLQGYGTITLGFAW